jgi:glycosyltransferase involved in cell wall biosynthesis
LGGKPHVITCHDMLAIRAAFGEIAESPTGWSGRIYQRWILRNLRKAQLAACVSRQTSEDLQRLTGLSGRRAIIVPNALNYPYRPMAAEESAARVSELGLVSGRPFFFHVGSNSWYKNRPGVLRIFAEVVKRPGFELHSLVMAGKPWTAEMRQLVHDLGVQDRVFELVDVTNEGLRALYSAAEALLFPSLAEGFGWPIIEAQACGCPVVTTGREPMTVVGGAAAVYITPDDVTGSAGSIVSALANREALVQMGLRNAERFSGARMTDGYIDAYRKVLESEPETGAFCGAAP